MARAISVLVAVLMLLGAGFFLGQRPISTYKERLQLQEEEFQARAADFESRARNAESRGFLWEARAELVLAAHDAGQQNFGTAKIRTDRARDLITKASGVDGGTVRLGEIRNIVEAASRKLGTMEPDAGDILLRAVTELGRLLEKVGEA